MIGEKGYWGFQLVIPGAQTTLFRKISNRLHRDL